MIAILRKRRLYWALGAFLLVASFAGSRWLVRDSIANDGDAPPAQRPSAALTGDFVINIGHVDAESGIQRLNPLQGGRVKELWVREGDEVAEGDLLLRLDDRFARNKLERAQADLQGARAKLALAQSLPSELAATKKALENKIKAEEHILNGYRSELEYKEKKFKNGGLSIEDLTGTREKVNAQESAVAGEKANLEKLEVKIKDAPQAVALTRADVADKEAQLELARLGLLECDLYAPADGAVLRINCHTEESVGADSRMPAIEFCPAGPRTVRAEVMQEWANRVKVGQAVIIQDDTSAGLQWQGTVKRVGDWYGPRRSVIQEPFQLNDVRTLDCIVAVEPGGPPLRIGQRVKVIVK